MKITKRIVSLIAVLGLLWVPAVWHLWRYVTVTGDGSPEILNGGLQC